MKTTLKKLSQKELHNLIGSAVILTENHTTISGDRVLKKKGSQGILVDYQMFWGEATIQFGKRNYKVSMGIVQLLEQSEEIEQESSDVSKKAETEKATDIKDGYIFTETKTIDQILDEHNDYMSLYRIFNDDAYLEKARQTLQQLKSHE
ncbi:hypothetical protein SRCM100169_02025 [Bacillus siamensis]|uniref:hypothetical protein n=1 Tax=Bacillus siamensis TaxID=659243 RepID=UPI0007EB22AE|nr:hypothetical protein [Bacillus siamensis]OAZ62802.1 hypothetical protein SRCM100169_02025 [Bacillus siamensis]